MEPNRTRILCFTFCIALLAILPFYLVIVHEFSMTHLFYIVESETGAFCNVAPHTYIFGLSTF
jgi:hypothetical protein